MNWLPTRSTGSRSCRHLPLGHPLVRRAAEAPAGVAGSPPPRGQPHPGRSATRRRWVSLPPAWPCRPYVARHRPAARPDPARAAARGVLVGSDALARLDTHPASEPWRSPARRPGDPRVPRQEWVSLCAGPVGGRETRVPRQEWESLCAGHFRLGGQETRESPARSGCPFARAAASHRDGRCIFERSPKALRMERAGPTLGVPGAQTAAGSAMVDVHVECPRAQRWMSTWNGCPRGVDVHLE
jgi:hypothetical protein